MNYDLSLKKDRSLFIKRANNLLKNQRTNVALVDESNRTLNQNSYIHVLCRILAADTGVSEQYAKQVYFKELANPDIFISVSKDSITGKMVKFSRSTCELTLQEMRKAISNFRDWAADNGYYLPDANIADDGTVSFSTDDDKAAFHQAEIQTSRSFNLTK